jgi:hypothetical protein
MKNEKKDFNALFINVHRHQDLDLSFFCWAQNITYFILKICSLVLQYCQHPAIFSNFLECLRLNFWNSKNGLHVTRATKIYICITSETSHANVICHSGGTHYVWMSYMQSTRKCYVMNVSNNPACMFFQPAMAKNLYITHRHNMFSPSFFFCEYMFSPSFKTFATNFLCSNHQKLQCERREK